MAIGLRDPSVESPRDEAMTGGRATRGFWTKRKRTATSLITVMGLIAGIAVAYKLFERAVPNNVVRDASAFSYDITAKDLAAQETNFRAVTGTGDEVIFRQTMATANCGAASTAPECNVDTFPGDERRTDVIIKNTQAPAHKASWTVYVNNTPTDPIQVLSYDKATNSYTQVPATNPDYNRYLNFWKLSVDKQTLFNLSPASSTPYENDPAKDGSYSPACAASGLKELTRQNPCNLGTIEGAGTMGSSIGPLTSKPLDDRQYRFFMEEADDGTDQSKFQGWRVVFTLVFAAKVPADAETGRFSTIPQ
ncbi:MAG TPA: hypothetical protein VNE62_01805 [Actinomycetota bacterium]|nr:hypothetical protein [Actinomycetota bacterium]